MKRIEKERGIPGLGFLALALILMFAVYPIRAQAASYKALQEGHDRKLRTVSSTVFDWLNCDSELYATKNGKRRRVYQAPSGYAIGDTIISNGSEVYFCVYKSEDGAYSKYIFYHCTVSGKNLKKLASRKNLYSAKLTGIYGNGLYLIFEDKNGKYGIEYLDLNNGKRKKKITISSLFSLEEVKQNGKYIYFIDYDRNIRAYNASSGKLKIIVKGVNAYALACDSKYIYCLKRNDNFDDVDDDDYDNTSSLIRYRTDGSGKKTLAKNLEIYNVVTFTSSYITYYTEWAGDVKTKKF